MSKKLKVDIRTSAELFGGETYTIHVDITNLTSQVIEAVSVTPQYLPGNMIYELPTDTELDSLKRKKGQIINEMLLQAKVSSLYLSREKQNFLNKFIWDLSMSMATSFGLPENTLFSRARWAREFLSIDDWSDVERLEKEYITPLEDKYRVKRAFMLDKEKLQEIQNKILENEQTQIEQAKNLKDSYSIQAGETISFTYKAKSPLLLRAKTYSLQFNISYNQNNNTISTFSAYQRVSFYPSPLAIPIGAAIGAIIGYIIRIGLVSSALFTWFNFLGCIALAVVFALLTVRTSNSKKLITTEDFVGGLILGALVSISSEAILGKLKLLISQT